MKYEKPSIEEIRILETQNFLCESPMQDDPDWDEDDTSDSNTLQKLANFWSGDNSESETPNEGGDGYEVVDEPTDSGSFFDDLFDNSNDADDFTEPEPEPELEPTNDEVDGF